MGRSKIALALVGVLLLAAAGEAQFRGRGPGIHIASPEDTDGAFHFCRVWFRSSINGDGGNWSVDFPRADINLSIRLSELTKTTVPLDQEGEPKHLVVRLTDDALYGCPFVMMTEVGSAFLDDKEAARFRDYLLKGGFLWADDFWGSYAWDFWINQWRKVLPPSEYPIVDIPPDHPLFHMQFNAKLVQISNIGFWLGTGGTSERGADSAVPHARGVSDSHGRLMVLMTHNTDYGDAFEREGDDPSYFYKFGADGYAFGINVLLYAMTH
jgi:hypothetical protein